LKAIEGSQNPCGNNLPFAALLLTIVAVCECTNDLDDASLIIQVQRAFQAWSKGSWVNTSKFTEATTSLDIKKWYEGSVKNLSVESWTKILASADEFVTREPSLEPAQDNDDAYVVQDRSSPIPNS
jgi:hypothetical protein